MKRKSFVFVLGFLLLFSAILSAQTAEKIEELLGLNAINYGQAALFVLEAADISGPDGFFNQPDAFRYAVERKWLPKNATADGKASLAGISLLIMRSFGLKGGIFYSAFKNPHYAYRELEYREVLQGRIDPAMAVSGDLLLYMVNRIFFLDEEEGGLINPVPSYNFVMENH